MRRLSAAVTGHRWTGTVTFQDQTSTWQRSASGTVLLCVLLMTVTDELPLLLCQVWEQKPTTENSEKRQNYFTRIVPVTTVSKCKITCIKNVVYKESNTTCVVELLVTDTVTLLRKMSGSDFDGQENILG